MPSLGIVKQFRTVKDMLSSDRELRRRILPRILLVLVGGAFCGVGAETGSNWLFLAGLVLVAVGIQARNMIAAAQAEYERPSYEEPFLAGGWTVESVEALIAAGKSPELSEVPVAVALNPTDCEWSFQICISLADNENAHVRGNAMRGFGHLARTCPDRDLSEIAPLLSMALDDESGFVRGHAETAHEAIAQFRGVALFESPGGAVWFRVIPTE